MNVEINDVQGLVGIAKETYIAAKDSGLLSEICEDILTVAKTVGDMRIETVKKAFEAYRALGLSNEEAIELIKHTRLDIISEVVNGHKNPVRL